jgi:hypothetical protein
MAHRTKLNIGAIGFKSVSQFIVNKPATGPKLVLVIIALLVVSRGSCGTLKARIQGLECPGEANRASIHTVYI